MENLEAAIDRVMAATPVKDNGGERSPKGVQLLYSAATVRYARRRSSNRRCRLWRQRRRARTRQGGLCPVHDRRRISFSKNRPRKETIRGGKDCRSWQKFAASSRAGVSIFRTLRRLRLPAYRLRASARNQSAPGLR